MISKTYMSAMKIGSVIKEVIRYDSLYYFEVEEMNYDQLAEMAEIMLQENMEITQYNIRKMLDKFTNGLGYRNHKNDDYSRGVQAGMAFGKVSPKSTLKAMIAESMLNAGIENYSSIVIDVGNEIN